MIEPQESVRLLHALEHAQPVEADRAGGGSCTFAVSEIEAAIDGLKKLGIDPGKLIDGGKAKVLIVNDPNGISVGIFRIPRPMAASSRNTNNGARPLPSGGSNDAAPRAAFSGSFNGGRQA
jgi:hypothetical protein